MAVRTYDPKLVTVTFGPIILEGYMDGTFVSMAQNGDNFEKSKGADGEIDRVNKNSNDWSITVTLKQTSPSNTQLSAQAAADKLANTGKFPLTITDLGGTSLFFAQDSWIGKEPDSEYSDTISSREWRFDTGPAQKIDGQNS